MTAPITAAGVAPVAAPGGSTAVSSSSLLPDPQPLTGTGIDAALGGLYAMMAQQRQGALQIGQTRVLNAEEVQKQALQHQREAEARERANQTDQGGGFMSSLSKTVGDVVNDVTHGRIDQVAGDGTKDVSDAVNSPAFWHDLEKGALVVAKVAAVVGSVAVTVASGGAGAVALAGAAALLSVGGEVVSDTKCFGKDSDGVALGMEIGGAVAGGASGFVSATSSATDGTLGAVGATAHIVSGGAKAVAGVAHVENATFAAHAQLAAADATQAKHQAETMQRLTNWIIDDMKGDDKSNRRALDGVRSAIEASDQAAAATVMPPTTLRG